MAIGVRPRLVVVFGLRKSWHGDSERHSEAAKKGWERRRRGIDENAAPQLLNVEELEDAVDWYDRNLAGRDISSKHGYTVRCPEELGEHVATQENKEGVRIYDPGRAKRLSWIEPTIRYGQDFRRERVSRADKHKRVLIAYYLEDPQKQGMYYVVIVRRVGKRYADLVTALPTRDLGYIEKVIGQRNGNTPC